MDKTNNPNQPSPLAEARAALAAREFQRAIDICNEVFAQDPSNDEAQRLGAQASEKMEAAPFVDQFIATCRTHIANANESAARTALEKARALEADHPDIPALEMELSAISGAPPDAAPASFDFGSSFGASSDASSGFSFGEPSSSSSFVVDNKPAPESSAPSHSSAPASDFGFTFEEEKPAPSAGGFSFDPTPAAPADPSFASGASTEVTVGEANTFDFAAGGVEVSADDAARISKYLSEGDELFEAGEYATAIDTWSRIFLIDVTNEQASERIERARGKRLETDQQVDELMVAATLAFEKK
ncbi:MAG TPA: hypothetical protein VIL97_06200, partial [Thermoanaerobaculia bacterium]